MSTSPRVLRSFVNGKYVDPETDATIEVVSPVTAQVVATAPASSVSDVIGSMQRRPSGECGPRRAAQVESAHVKVEASE